MTVKKDGRVVARDNEMRVLRALHRFGWLRTRDIASLVWQVWCRKAPDAIPDLQPLPPTASALRMAQRTLRRLKEARAVLSAQAPDGSTLYALALGGVRILTERGIESASGKDQIRARSGAYFRHRCIANEVAIGAIVSGYKVSSEREIAQGLWLGGKLGVAGKLPDVLIRNGAQCWWVEVERSRKNASDYAKLLAWLAVMRLPDARTFPAGSTLQYRLEKILFICSPAFKARLTKELLALGWQTFEVETLIFFEMSLYSFKDINFA